MLGDGLAGAVLRDALFSLAAAARDALLPRPAAGRDALLAFAAGEHGGCEGVGVELGGERVEGGERCKQWREKMQVGVMAAVLGWRRRMG